LSIEEIEMGTPEQTAIIATGLLFLITFISGAWLSRNGRPLNTAIFTIHKLISLLTLISTALTIYNYASGKW
jgi:hypothetical protein